MIRCDIKCVSFVLCSAAFIACGGGRDGAVQEEESTGWSQAPIIRGSADNHDEVVSLYDPEGGGLCTGTIVATKQTTGYVLTAAHCCKPGSLPTLVGIGAALRTATQYPITAIKAHASYEGTGTPYDFCMVSFTDPDGNMKVIPPLPPELDTIQVGAALDAIGFGRTDTNPRVPLTDPKRLHVTYSTVDFSSNHLLAQFDAREGGTCQGDSGGPDLVTVGGKTYVYGVHSTVSGITCNGTAESGVVSKVHSWIRAYIDGAP
ncbi:trypsin-like serine protease [Pendulispora rubella]|uniref:Trypsin-like serine protease n=1 Tax=Pendulispora rubella TaxID=2741070 RepID=A0ABZ2L7B6_9BACT